MSSLEETLEQLQKRVDELYALSENYSIPGNERNEKIRKDVEILTAEIKSLLATESQLNAKTRGRISYLHGKTLDALPSYSKEAETLLSAAVKLDPRLTDAWNCLGESYWKKNELENAKNCFIGAMDQSEGKKPNKVSLRRLSMVLRQIGKDGEREENVKESLLKAKEAVKLDLKDGESWYVLGNAHLALFFTISHSSSDMTAALKAYQQAENAGVLNPDLHFNRGILHKYAEDFDLAIVQFSKSAELDTEATRSRTEIDSIVDFVTKISTKKRSLKKKKLENVIRNIPKDITKYNRTVTPLSSLSLGGNPGKVVLGTVIDDMPTKGFPPMYCQTFIIDVSIYNISEASIHCGDILCLIEPVMKQISFHVDKKIITSDDKQLNYHCLHIFYPNLIINNKTPNAEHYALTQITVEKGLE